MKFNKQADAMHTISWSSGPSLQYTVLINNLSSINFRIQIWKQILNHVTLDEKLELRGEVYVFIQKFLGQVEFRKIDRRIVKEGRFEKEVYLNGTKEGLAQIELIISHPFYFQQKMAGV